MQPYYQDEHATIYNARCEDVLPHLDAGSVGLIATDPPYFRVKDEAWDRAWKSADAFIGWLGDVTDGWRRVLAPNGSLYCFAGTKLSGRTEAMLAERFNVLNRVTWAKPRFSTKAEMFRKEDMRAYFPTSEAVIFAEQYGDQYADASDRLRGRVFEPLRAYLDGERIAAGLKDKEARARMGLSVKGGGLLSHFWGRAQWMLPTADQYAKLQAAYPGHFLRPHCDLKREYEDLRREYEDLRREYEDLRRPFYGDALGTYSDVWTFPTVGRYPGKHPCEKPLAMMEHIVRTSSRPDDLVLDCFMGSGATLQAAANLGRKAIGVEMDERWCEKGAQRLANAPLTLEAV